MTGPQYPGQNPEGQDPQYGSPQPGQPQYGQPQYGQPQYGQPQYGQPQYPAPDLSKGGAEGSYPPPGQYPPPPPVGQQQYGEQGIYSTSGQPAGAGVRLGARIIDGLIVGIPVAIVEGIIGVAANYAVYYVVSVILSFAAILYFTYFESRKGATLGKQLLKLRTVGPDGNIPAQDIAFKRNIWLLLSVLSSLLAFIFFLPFLVGLATLGVLIAIGVTISNDPNKQGLHDKFAGGTRVVRV
ncbi:hypothetical protein ASG12_03090 [Williamsia sp. Leaf354]|uniref:RDD family protein n=1 Tax=Williamsia sp. Leaf354 TaxID=1736349 RepID=UPI0006F86E13|nr:RDD family protein [Williamsia sp. Leaf354]KQR99777.1 hypothetical protein ASG12_03090 [Williamsia sp. Leaf354]